MEQKRALVLFLILFLVLVLVGSVVAIVALIDGGDSVEEGSMLVLDIAGSMPDQPSPDDPIAQLRSAPPISILEIDSALRKAGVDENIERVLVRIGGLGIGWGKLEELRGALTRFRESSGKQATCYMEQASNKEYLLATACDEVFMAPEGFFLVNGLHLGVTFYKGALDKLGVDAEFTRAGKYKSAVEAYTHTEMSEPMRTMFGELADGIFGHLVAAIAESRALDESAVRALIDDPPLTAAAAWRAGLIDGLYYYDQLLRHLSGEDVPTVEAIDPEHMPKQWEQIATALGEGRPTQADEGFAPDPGAPEEAPAQEVTEAEEQPMAEPGEASKVVDDDDLIKRVSLDSYRSVKPSSVGLGGGPKVAVVFCEGQIVSGSSGHGNFGGKRMGSDTIAAAIRKARKDESIKAIVLRVDSPGGSGLASDIIWREVELARRSKPVVVSMSDLAASGGYYISMGADAIVAQPTTITGSIGVFAGKYNLAGLFEKIGLSTDGVKRGEMADLFSMSRGLGEEGRRKLREFVDAFYATFISKAAAGRKTSPAAIHSVAQGRVWTGAQALDEGLVDSLGGFRDALALAKEKAGIEGEHSLVLYPKQPTLLEQLLEGSDKRGIGILAPMMDIAALRARAGAGTPGVALRSLLDASPLMSSGLPVLMAPYHLEIR